MENNFCCDGCKTQKFISSHSSKLVNGEFVHMDVKTKKEILCDECKKPLSLIPKPMGSPAIGKIASMTNAQRSEVLAKRSKDHFNKKEKEAKHEKLKPYGLSNY